MSHPAQLELARRLVAQIHEGLPAGPCVGEVPASHYGSPDHFARERKALFERLPQIVALEHDLAEPGACLTVELAGVPLLLTHDRDGELHAFRNACRHRGTRLIADGPCRRKAFVCPYHGWTYDLAGRLLHVPHAEAFDGRTAARAGLSAVALARRHGFVWAALEPFDLATYLGPIDDELAELSAGSWSVFRRSTREVAGNWKLIVDAFLDGYHIRHLHRDSIAGFFLDARAEAERAGLHIRAVTGRRGLAERSVALDASSLRELVTPSYLVFPCAILILHPDYLSVVTLEPLAVDRTRFVHVMLTPARPSSEREAGHWERSFALIDEAVFAREDLFIVEAMQRGIASGANETLLFGSLEGASLWFHDAIAQALARGA